ncbi:MAG TPA: PIN domain-containing protein [Ktedonobacterales bacterium]|nr:PIN domain-containing protein [Ktedonobacterales bacterium]
MSARFVTRIVGLLVAATIALLEGINIAGGVRNITHVTSWSIIVGVALVAGLVGLAIAPYVTLVPYRWVREQIRRANVSTVVAGVIGLTVGLIIAALLTLPISQLKFLGLGTWLPTVVAIACGSLGVGLAVQLRQDFVHLLSTTFAGRAARRAEREEREGDEREERDDLPLPSREGRSRLGLRSKKDRSDRVLVDTSAIIDGRIADISQTGFITGTLTVPRFVLEELQHIADSSDSLRRNRGRRGLEILGRLQKEGGTPVEISDADAEDTPEVDAKLVKLARQWHCSIITNDFNLNRVAALQGVKVLNINELAHAVKPILLPGEEMTVKVIQDGKEYGQGVGYLDDGTMIVVESGKQFIGSDVEVTVTRVLQTIAGRMIFAQPKQGQSVGSAGTARRGEN